ncbi:hypothetical protein VOLCADRAFT_77347 [Volvox carteri f. nagariensis]|uniref:Carbonic anhydrase n=1 Tax=Volvox carteri f. nagariensis TaxID=3068 RepID=D8UE45_VOLCA|nr:uncharacterized protein VOLCADRAFT_77347 [Volvox carteri f. nagariensis]EFJ42025.1 hypothetical protein VOLCADRAFT_77347 [Volvox carteri f. nagariensis]|eukprot:XP_002956900.1 hypothetical protein VOLCADRAFT_77347 [Volvox carteri f. nagariensis]
MGSGASTPRNDESAMITRVAPASQAVSEANTVSAAGFPEAKSSKSLFKIGSLSDRATCEQVLQALMDGNERFLKGASARPHQDFTRVQQISEKQKPHSAILGCADSRVPAEIVFDQGFGDVFVCRVAGNIATAEEIASLEYAVLDLGVKVVMILGHTKCGAVKAALSGKAFPGFIDTLVDHIEVAIARVDGGSGKAIQKGNGTAEVVDKVVRENVKYQVQRCQRSTIIQEGIQKRTLMLVGAVYNLETGKVSVIVTKGGNNLDDGMR